jgi:hypothetical protein
LIVSSAIREVWSSPLLAIDGWWLMTCDGGVTQLQPTQVYYYDNGDPFVHHAGVERMDI